MSDKGKKRLFTAIRIAVCVGALAWVVQGVTYYDYVTTATGQRVRLIEQTANGFVIQDGDARRTVHSSELVQDEDGSVQVAYGLRAALQQSNLQYLLLSLLVFAPVPFLQSLRFTWMLRAQLIEISYWESVKLAFAGNFMNFVAIGSTGGDLVKAYYITLHTHQKTEAIATVFLDRVVGLVGLLITVVVVVALTSRQTELLVLGGMAALVLLGLAAGCVLLVSSRLRGLVSRIPGIRSLPPSDVPGEGASRLQKAWAYLRRHGGRADRATQRLLSHKKLVLGSLGATVLLQLFAMCDFVLLCFALGMQFDGGKMWDYYAVIATGNIVAAVPISFQGLGTTEAVYRHFLLGTHGTLPQILCMAMAIRVLHLVWALPGLLVVLTGAYRPQEAFEALVITPNGDQSESLAR